MLIYVSVFIGQVVWGKLIKMGRMGHMGLMTSLQCSLFFDPTHVFIIGYFLNP
jgi:hypothetical protein